MTKRSKSFWLILFLAESLAVSGDHFSRWIFDKGLFRSGSSSADKLIFFLFGALSLGFISLILVPAFREKILDEVGRIIYQSKKGLAGVVFILVWLSYESFQDLIFLQDGLAADQYQGYHQLLLDQMTIVGWIFLVSVQLLIIIFLTRKEQIRSWFKERSPWEWIVLILIAAGSILLFNQGAIGILPREYDQKWFEELNSPLLGLQVVLVVLALGVIGTLLSLIKTKSARASTLLSDRNLFIALFLLAFLSWYGKPLQPTTFTDIPRPPNYESYPNSDALGYQLSAQELLTGGGTGRSNHIGFMHFLSLIDLATGSDVQLEYLLRLALISVIPAVLFLLVKTFSGRFAGLLVGSMFILREVNAAILVEFITFPQLRDGLTEPFTILGLCISLALLAVALKREKKQPILFLLAGGFLGWIVLLRIEALVYVAAIGLGLLIFLWKSRQGWLRRVMFFSLGVLLVAGPWFFAIVQSTGSIKSIWMGKTNLIRNSYQDFSAGQETTQEPDNFNKQEMFPYNLGNNIMSLFYYLPSNHQPLLTVNNLPDVVLNRIDDTDLEGDSFREKYLERYLRSLPFWWNDWDGRLPARSILPLFLSLVLVFFGFLQLRRKSKPLAGILVLISATQILIYSFVGKSGGRFIQVVDWIPLVFYGIGISGVLQLILKDQPLVAGEVWFSQAQNADPETGRSEGFGSGMILAGFLLLLFGLSVPLAEFRIPARYTGDQLARELVGLEENSGDGLELSELIHSGDPELEVVYGKALYPRFFAAGTSLGDPPKGRYTDYTIGRVEFFLVGTERIWIGLPGFESGAALPHGSEVIILGRRTPQVQYEPGLEPDPSGAGEYIKAFRIYLLDQQLEDGQTAWIDCSGSACEFPEPFR